MQYKAVGGEETPDISTQAGSLETFELLARMGAWNGWTGGSGCEGREAGMGIVGEGFQGSHRGGWVETDKINNE